VHDHLDGFLNGRPVRVPGGIGVDITDPAVHEGITDGAPGYGGIPPTGCPQPCVSPLHTHFVNGVIHIEAPAKSQFTLGEFFREWGVRLDASCVGGYCRPAASVAVFVDGKRTSGDPANVLLGDHDEIAIIIGTPPDRIPAKYAFAPSDA